MTQEERDNELAGSLETIHSGANWFYWIVGLSLVNVVLALAEADRHFIIGLALSEVATGFIIGEGANTFFIAFGVSMILSILGFFLFVGKKAHQPHKSLFLAGIIVYVVDGLLYLAFSDFLSAGFHGFAVYNMWNGYKAIDTYHAILDEPITVAEPEMAVAEIQEPVLAPIDETSLPKEEDPYKPLY